MARNGRPRGQTSLELSRIRLDAELQPRSSIDSDLVEEYTHRMLEDVEFPAVTVFDDGEVLWLADGYHRHYAAQAAGRTEILGTVVAGDRMAALVYSLRANAEHGRQRNSADYQRAYQIAVRHGLVVDTDAAAVASVLGCSRRWAELLTKAARERKQREDEAAIIRAKAEGKSVRQIASDLEMKRSTVQDTLTAVRKTNPSLSGQDTWTPDDIPKPAAKVVPDPVAIARFDISADVVGCLLSFDVMQHSPADAVASLDPLMIPKQVERATAIRDWLNAFLQAALEIRHAA